MTGGIEARVRLQKGDSYWETHKHKILREANKHGNLNTRKVKPNARQRRFASRHPPKVVRRALGPRHSASWRVWFEWLQRAFLGEQEREKEEE